MASAAPNEELPDEVTNAMLRGCKRLGDPQLSHVWQYNATTVIKRISPPSAAAAEAAAMRLARERTSAPVPRILKTIIPENENEYGVIFMEFVEGETLEEAWPSMADEDKRNVLAQLKDFMHQVHQVEGEFIGSVDQSVCNDQLFSNREHVYGPFQDEDAFRQGIAQSLRACDANSFTQLAINMVNSMPKSEHIVLTHGDFVPRNILVRDGGNVTAIVDWEMAGFYPEYWEYAKAHFFADYEHPWQEERAIDQVLEPYLLELGALLHTRGIFMY